MCQIWKSFTTSLDPTFRFVFRVLNIGFMSILNSVHFIWSFGYLMSVVWNEQTHVLMRGVWRQSFVSGAEPLLHGARPNHCEQRVSGSQRFPTLSSGSQEMNPCAHPISAAVFMRRRRHYGCIWKDICHWMKVYFAWLSTFVEQMEMHRWVILCCAFWSTLLPVHRALDDVQFVSVFETSSHGSKGRFSKRFVSRTLFVMSTSFKGAISCQLFFFFWLCMFPQMTTCVMLSVSYL